MENITHLKGRAGFEYFIDSVNKALGVGAGNRLELILAMAYFIIGALLLRPVVEPKRGRAAAPPPSTLPAEGAI